MDSIIFLDDLKEYVTTSKKQLIDRYTELQYKVILILFLNWFVFSLMLFNHLSGKCYLSYDATQGAKD